MNKFDYDLIVIGGGAAGLTASTGAGQLGAKTLLIEKKSELGGDCLHYGCVPSKSLIKSAYIYNAMRHSSKYGLPEINLPSVDYRKVRERIQRIIATIQKYDSPESIKEKYNVNTLFGSPQFINEHTIDVNRQKITAKNFIIATGSSARIPEIEGLKSVPYITNEDVFSLDELPASLIILGGGPIGVEMAQAFSRLGSKVVLLQHNVRLLPKEDPDISELIEKRLKDDGVEIYTGYDIEKIEQIDGKIRVLAEKESSQLAMKFEADKILICVGRKANVEGLGLDNLGIDYSSKCISVDQHLKTDKQNIYACGDVNGGFQFTHVAGYEASIAMVNAVLHLPASVDYGQVPWVTYTDPEIASVGYNEQRAKAAGIEYSLDIENFRNNDRALAEGETEGFIKLLVGKKGIPIGVQIVGFHAGDMLSEWVAVLNGQVKLSTIAQSIHAYPTMAEINKTASGNYLAPQFFNNPVIKWLSSI